MQSKEHWEHVYSTKATDAVSWFQRHLETSLRLIEQTGVSSSAAILDVGGGASTLADDLLSRNFTNITVLDLSAAALRAAQTRLGSRADQVIWLEADITRVELAVHAYDVWHDRAIFHFLTKADDRHAYVNAVLRAVKPGGHVIVATFADDGPTKCSGLPVMRYNADALHAEFGAPFTLVQHDKEAHHTPFGTIQQFTYCHYRTSAS
jgi:ubiquinone/menaquinone biosynthesis C-methylase UbiE